MAHSRGCGRTVRGHDTPHDDRYEVTLATLSLALEAHY
jgi:hypothetical protein